MHLAGRNIVMLGLGRHGGGVAAARYLHDLGARLTVCDRASDEQLQRSLRSLRDCRGLTLRLGVDEPTLSTDADVLVVNPAVPPNHPWVQIARERELPILSEIELFLRACRARIIGVTGTNGKSTTAAMVAAVLRRAGGRVWLGGNIGRSLLPVVNRITADDWVVLELSSFQLHYLSCDAPMPQIAVVTGLSPNHLDWHLDFPHYRDAKLRLISGQSERDVAIFDPADEALQSFGKRVRGRFESPAAIDEVPPLRVLGAAARSSAALALRVADELGISKSVARQALSSFPGLPHRLRPLGRFEGRLLVNDSKSTTPDALVAALDAVPCPVWLLCGGVDKGFDLTRLAASLVDRAKGAAVFGSVAPRLDGTIKAVDPGFDSVCLPDLAAAAEWCWQQSADGETILLSPGFASHDQYADFAARGRHFQRLARQLPVVREPRLEIASTR